jgi:hypothetical protein
MAPIVKFASVPIKYAPKRKMTGFALPKWPSKLGEVEDEDVASFINSLYQDRTFKTQKEFNEAYDNRLLELLHWGNKPMALTREDVLNFETTHENGAFDCTKPGVVDALLTRIKAHLATGEKVIFVY